MIKEIYVHVPAFLPETKRTFVKLRDVSEQPSVWGAFESSATKNTAVLEFKACLSKVSNIANVPLLGMKLVSNGSKCVLYHTESKNYYAVCEQMLQFIQPFAHNLENTPMQLVNLTLVKDTVPSPLEEVSFNSFVPVEAIEQIKNSALNPSEDPPKYPLQVEEQRTSVCIDGSNVDNRYLVELFQDSALIHFKIPGELGWLNLECRPSTQQIEGSDIAAYQILRYNMGITSQFSQSKSSLQEISSIVEMNAEDAWEERVKGSPVELALIRMYCTAFQDFFDKYPSIVNNVYQDKLRHLCIDNDAVVDSQAVEFVKFSEMGHKTQNELATDILLSLYFQPSDSSQWMGKKSAVIVPSPQDNNTPQLKSMRFAITSDKVPHLKFEDTSTWIVSETKYKVSCRISQGVERRGHTHSYSLEPILPQLVGVEYTDLETIKTWLATTLQDCYLGLVRMPSPNLYTMRLHLSSFNTAISSIPIKRIQEAKAYPLHEQDPFMVKIIQAYKNSTN
jgi:hypothetical protein